MKNKYYNHSLSLVIITLFLFAIPVLNVASEKDTPNRVVSNGSITFIDKDESIKKKSFAKKLPITGETKQKLIGISGLCLVIGVAYYSYKKVTSINKDI